MVNHDGTGNKSIYEGRFMNENYTFRHEGPGYLSMAAKDEFNNGSQFFVTTEAAPFLDYKHVVFGYVREGMDVIEEIESFGSESGRVDSRIIVDDCGVLKE